MANNIDADGDPGTAATGVSHSAVPKLRSLARLMGLGTLYARMLNASVRVANPVAIANSKSIYRARQRRAMDSTVAYVEQHMADVPACGNKKELLEFAFSKADVSNGRLICEFGVYRAKSLNHLASLTDRQVFGFDAFQGLPSGQSDHWKKGDFHVDGLPKVRPNVSLVNGWFDETLPDFLSQHPEPVGFVHVDSDLYSSAKILFELMEKRLKPGTVVVFDEFFNYPGWQQGEFKALEEFLEKTALAVEFIGYNRNGEQVALKIVEP